MKTWAVRVKAVSFVAAAILISTVLVFAGSHSVAKRNYQIESSRTASSLAKRLKSSPRKSDSQLLAAYGKLPLSFEENQGQTAQEVRYLSHGSGYDLFLTSQEAVVSVTPHLKFDFSPRHRMATLRALRDARRSRSHAQKTATIRLQLADANPQPRITGADLLPGKVNYFLGNDPKKWRAGIPTYSRVQYAAVYPGIDLVFYGNQRSLEYDFVVAPGADPSAIALNINGARKMHMNAAGDVVLGISGGEVALQKPVVYQQVNGKRHEIAGTYLVAENHRVKFSVGAYDRSQPLIIDPVLNYSTYVGGSGSDEASAIAVDGNGDAFIAGTTTSPDFPTFNAAQSSVTAGGFAAFVSELNPAGTTLLYSTYLAGTAAPSETAFGIALDSTGKIYITGQTASTDFPTTANGLKTGANANASTNGTSYIAKFDPSLATAATLVYSSYIGGNNLNLGVPNGDVGQAIAADPTTAGIVYVVGYTDSTPGATLDDFPTPTGFQTTLSGSANAGTSYGNAFLVKMDTRASGSSSLVYSTYLGGDGVNGGSPAGLGVGDVASGVATDGTGKVYLAGATSSTDLGTLTANGEFLTYPAGNSSDAAFFAQVDTTKTGASSLLYLTYLGGSGPDIANAVALGPNNVAYIVGESSSTVTLFPTVPAPGNPVGSYPSNANANGVVFLSLVDTSKSAANSLTYSTLFGGSGGDSANGVAVDINGNAYFAGATASTDLPVTPGALQSTLAAGASGNGFVAELNPGGNGTADLIYSSYFGGSGDGVAGDNDTAEGIALDSSKNAYITGHTFSATNFPVAGTPAAPLTAGLNGPDDGFVAKLTLEPTLVVSPLSLNFGALGVNTTSAPQTITLTNNTGAAIAFTSAIVSGGSPAAANTDYVVSANTCGVSIPTGASPANQCTISVTFKPSVIGAETANLVLTDADSTSPQSIALTGTGASLSVSPTTLAFGSQLINTASAAMTVTLTNNTAAAIAFTSAAVSGGSPAAANADYAISANTCGASIPTGVAPANQCTISVIFTPSVPAAETANLVLTDADPSSPQTVTLTGTGTSAAGDFTISAAPTSQTVASGGVGTPIVITVTPVNNLTAAVNLTCTGAPANSSCVLSPTSVTSANGTTPQTSNLTFTAHAFLVPLPISKPTPPLNMLRVIPLMLAILLLFLLRSAQRLRTRLVMVSAMLVFVCVAGCSSRLNNNHNAAKGTSTLTVTGTSGALSHSTTISITVD